MKKHYFKALAAIVTALLLCVTLFSACGSKEQGENSGSQTTAVGSLSVEYDSDDLDVSENNAQDISLNGSSITSSSADVSIDGACATITKGGVYRISGNLDDGSIIINSSDDSTVHIILAGATLNCSTSSAIFTQQAKKVVITLKDGTENTVNDLRAQADDSLADDETGDIPSAAIYSKDDLTFNGTGTLNVKGGYKNGIHTKDELKIVSGIINVMAVNDCIKGKDFVAVKDGNLSLSSTSGEGIQSTESTDTALGFVLIQGGTITAQSGDNAIKAESCVEITGGTLSLKADDNGIKSSNTINIVNGSVTVDSQEDAVKASSDDETVGTVNVSGGTVTLKAGKDGLQAASAMNITGGTINVTTTGEVAQSAQNDAPGAAGGFNPFTSTQTEQTSDDTSDSETVSSKGIKSGGTLTVSGGEISVNSTGHCVHSIGDTVISGGTLTLASSKGKGISAHGNCTISNGTITITESTEGIESKAVLTVDGGTIHITASDDGLNAGGGNSVGQGMQTSTDSSSHSIIINGGYIYIDAAGDGIDSNGNLTVNGGTVIVNGPTSDGDSALDSDGTISINGGLVIASGSTGMLETPASSSSQCSMVFGLTSNADSVVCVKDSDGNEILTFSPSKASASIIFSSAELKDGSAYTVYTGGTYSGGTVNDGIYTGGSYQGGTVAQTVTLSGKVTLSGVTSMGGGMAGGTPGGNAPGNASGQTPPSNGQDGNMTPPNMR